METAAIKQNLIKAKNVSINFILWLWQKVALHVVIFAVKCKIFVFVMYARARRWYWNKKWYVQTRVSGYKFIQPEQLLSEFPPRKGHKECGYGKGFQVVQLPNKQKVIRFCWCVTEQYKKSGKKYMVIQPK